MGLFQKTALILLACLGLQSAWAVNYSVLDEQHSSLRFVARQMGVPTDGAFQRFQAHIRFDPQQLLQAQAEIIVETASIDVGSTEANAEVQGKDWFDVKAHPQARFKATQLKALGGNRYEAHGHMTIRGRTLAVIAPFTARQTANGAQLEGVIPIKRLQYGIGAGAWSDTSIVADQVDVRFNFMLKATR